MSANSRLVRANLTRTTWVVEMCRPRYRACAADSHDHRQDPGLMFCFSELELKARFAAELSERELQEKRSDRPHPNAAAANPVCTYPDQSSENRGFGWTFPGQWIVGRAGWELLLLRSTGARSSTGTCAWRWRGSEAAHSAHSAWHAPLITAQRSPPQPYASGATTRYYRCQARRCQTTITAPPDSDHRPSGVSRLRLRDACPSSLSPSAKIAGQCRCMEPLKPTPNPQRLVPFSNPWPLCCSKWTGTSTLARIWAKVGNARLSGIIIGQCNFECLAWHELAYLGAGAPLADQCLCRAQIRSRTLSPRECRN